MVRRSVVLAVVPLALSALLAACGGSSQHHATSSASSAPSASTGATTTATAGATSGGDWLMAQHDETRSGAAVGRDLAHVAPKWRAPIDGQVYGQALVAGAQVIVGTTRDVVASFDVATGARRWSTTIGVPVPASALPCGNVDPVGITSTPAIDRGRGVVYAAGMTSPAKHELVALRLTDGHELFRRGVDAPGLDPKTNNQRGALLIANGRVYIPYGGRYGDCGTYHGAVVSVPLDGNGPSQSYVAPTQNEGGMWAPSGLVSDGHGAIYGVTGNSSSQGAYDYGNSVIRLSAELKFTDAFAPGDWKQLNRGDVDLGSQSPALVPASGGMPDRMVVAGKAGIAYVLDPARLGGVGGELSQEKLCAGAYGGTARRGRRVYVPCRDGVVAVDVGTADLHVAWRGPRFAAGPPILAAGLVWVVDVGGNDLHGLDAASGRSVVHFPLGDVTNFATPAAGGGALFVAGGGALQAFA